MSSLNEHFFNYIISQRYLQYFYNYKNQSKIKILNLMSEKGWYKMDTVEQQKIDTVKQKFNA